MVPYKRNMGQRINSDAPGVACDRGFIAHYQVAAANAVAASDTGVHAAITLADGEVTEVITGITNPKTPRALRIKGNAAGITGDVEIEGTNYAGEAISETIAANGNAAVEGTKAFKTVTKITVPARNAEADSISIGWNDKLGLPYKLAHNTVLVTYHDNALEGTPPTVTVSATALESNTADLNTALNGKAIDIYLIV